MKLLQVAEQNKTYYSADYTKGFNDGAKAQYEADKKDAERRGRWVKGDEMADYPRVPYKPWETYCSCCGEIKEQSNDGFCGNCGAKMNEVKIGKEEGDENEKDTDSV